MLLGVGRVKVKPFCKLCSFLNTYFNLRRKKKLSHTQKHFVRKILLSHSGFQPLKFTEQFHYSSLFTEFMGFFLNKKIFEIFHAKAKFLSRGTEVENPNSYDKYNRRRHANLTLDDEFL